MLGGGQRHRKGAQHAAHNELLQSSDAELEQHQVWQQPDRFSCAWPCGHMQCVQYCAFVDTQQL